ncbi:MAG TPA: hypothetical protein VFB25_08935 [Gaiellaceae bacterium]|nr:hypothetical protein [Gaiellaceae bacterium]
MEVFSQIELDVADDADECVFQWRREQLERAGYDPCTAVELAGRNDVDLHRAVELCRQGCPPHLAQRILT